MDKASKDALHVWGRSKEKYGNKKEAKQRSISK